VRRVLVVDDAEDTRGCSGPSPRRSADAAERAALGDLLAPDTPLTAITAALGQLGAATAVVQAIALGELLRRNAVPPIAGLSPRGAAHGGMTPPPRQCSNKCSNIDDTGVRLTDSR
jgi:hypothetical protein